MLHEKPLQGQSVVIDVSAGRVFRLRKSVMTTARLVNDRLKTPSKNPNGWRFTPVMVTYTYRPGVLWEKEHVAKAVDAMQAWATRLCGFRLPYLWVMELTKAGVPHYHLIVWMPSRFQMPKHDKRGWWPHGSTRVERVKNAVGYVAKYASKFASKDAEFPKSARIHGTGGLTAFERRVVAWWKLPKDLRHGTEGSCVWRRAPGGGWFNPETRQRVFPQWKIEAFSPGGKYVRIAPAVITPADVHFKEHFGFKAQEEKKQAINDGAETFLNERRRQGSRLKALYDAWNEQCQEEAMRLSLGLAALLETDRVAYLLRLETMAHLPPGV